MLHLILPTYFVKLILCLYRLSLTYFCGNRLYIIIIEVILSSALVAKFAFVVTIYYAPHNIRSGVRSYKNVVPNFQHQGTALDSNTDTVTNRLIRVSDLLSLVHIAVCPLKAALCLAQVDLKFYLELN